MVIAILILLAVAVGFLWQLHTFHDAMEAMEAEIAARLQRIQASQ